MPNRQLPGHTEPAAALAPYSPGGPDDFGLPMALLGLVISLIAMLVSVRANNLSTKRDKLSQFEADHGTALRLAIRALQSKVGDLRALSFPAGKSLIELQQEVPNLLGEIDALSFPIVNLITEIDQSQPSICIGWNVEILASFDDCLAQLERLTVPSITDVHEFRDRVRHAQARYDAALASARNRLQAIRSSL